MTPVIPAGYRRLRVGEKRPKGYRFWACSLGRFFDGIPTNVGAVIIRSEHKLCGPYIAPVARKGGKKGRAK